jgi:D-alanyl-D-alanine dipeptidase
MHKGKNRFVISLAAFLLLPQGFLFGEENPLIDIQKVNPKIRIEIRYATQDNFTHQTLYPEARCLLLREVAEKLSNVQKSLEKNRART